MEECSSAYSVFIPESNLGYEGTWQAYELDKAGINDLCIMKEDDNKVGVRTNNKLKDMMAIKLKAYLKNRKIYFHKNFVSMGVEKGDISDHVDLKKELVNQLLNYMERFIPSTDPYRDPKRILSGKDSGPDDLVIALQIAVSLQERFFTRSIYKKYWK